MGKIVRNVIAVIAGLFLGSIVNMGILMVSASIIPPPEGADLMTMEGLKESMHLMQPKHFIFPFLAHALGTFVGAIFASLIAATNKLNLALLVGTLFLVGGIINVIMLPSPVWFTILDLVGAYFPMAYLGGKMAAGKKA